MPDEYFLSELSSASGPDALLPPLGVSILASHQHFPRVCASPQSAGQEMYSRVHLSTLPTLMGSDTSVHCC